MIYAVIPAAGKSERMGRPKLTLPLGKSTVIEQVVTALHEGGIQRILVVVGPTAREVGNLASGIGAEVLRLTEDTPDMRSTVELGLQHLQELYSPKDLDDWLLVPADHPSLNAQVVRVICSVPPDTFSIRIPTHGGRRGHPTLVAWRHAKALAANPRSEGINRYLRRFPQETHEIEVDSPDILLDLDTPDDYDRLCKRFGLTLTTPCP